MIRSLFNTQPSSERSRTHAVVFDDPETTVHAVEAFMDDGFVIENVHSPFPVPGIDDALGLKETRLP
ncbi:MAG: DUF3341 domain-containing protein, partial [Candidatus Latescibacteria bacterium]|nr:DUF3341 domain-containing protein [Candidatus Latescibacterota bacterium]